MQKKINITMENNEIINILTIRKELLYLYLLISNCDIISIE